MNAEQSILTTLVEIESTRAHRIMGPAFHKVRDVAEPTLDISRWCPVRPFFLASNSCDAVPRQCILAHGYSVTNRFVVREDVVEIPSVGIDHNRPGSFFAMKFHHSALV